MLIVYWTHHWIDHYVLNPVGFSASEPKAQVYYCDHALSVVRLSSLTFHIFDFFSETAEQGSMKLDRKEDINVYYQVWVFLGRLEKQNDRPGFWLTATFSTETADQNQWNLTRSKNSTPPTKFVFSGPLEKRDDCPASDRMIHYRLLLWNCCTEFNETWQETRT